jgi:hypothetical protein
MKRRLQFEQLETRDCPAAGSRLIPIASGPGYSMSINSYGRFIVMNVTQPEFDIWEDNDGDTDVADEALITNRLYAAFGGADVFDFITVTTNIDATSSGLLGYNRSVRRTGALGTGAPPIDNGLVYGSPNQLASFLYYADRAQMRAGTGIHEIMHQWANDLELPTGIGEGSGHWGYSDVGGALGGWQRGTLVDLGGGNFTSDGPLGRDGWNLNDNTGTTGTLYSPLELYLMGLIPHTEVPDIIFAQDGDATGLDPVTGDFSATRLQTITSQDIVNLLGLREPVPYNADRNYRVANVLLTVGTPSQAIIDQFDTDVELFSRGGSDGDPNNYNFWEATGGRATLQANGLHQFLPNGGTINSFLSVAADNLRVTGYSSNGPNGYDTTRQVTPQLAEYFGDSPGEIRTATADVNGDTIPDFIVSNGAGAQTRFGVYDGDLKGGWIFAPHTPFRGSEDFTGGAYVSAGDMDGDGLAEIIVTADVGGGSRVVVFSFSKGDGLQVTADFLGIGDINFRGGARTAVGDINGDGFNDLTVVAGAGGGPRAAIYSGATFFSTRTKVINDFFAFPGMDSVRLRNGVYVAAGDINGDGFDDLIFGGGPGGAPRVFAVSGFRLINTTVSLAQANPLANYFVGGDTADRGGVRVAVKNIDDDGRADIVVGSGENSASRIRLYRGSSFLGSPVEPRPLQDLNPFADNFVAGGVYVG